MEYSNYKKIRSGFTLIELMVVIAIVGLLSSILLTSLGKAKSKAHDAQRTDQLHQISAALELYMNIYGQYPALLSTPVWDGNLCSNDPPCLAASDANWDNMISTLEAAKVLTLKPTPTSWVDQIAQLVFPNALAATHVQDPLYPTYRYAYMTSAVPLNLNYRLRAQFEDPGSPAIKSGLPGYFYWTDKATGIDACDPTLGIYCAGPPDNFSAFAPGKPVIYLYPTHTEQVAVTVDGASIDQSIPAYGTGWSVLAQPSGQLTNLSDGKLYPYLFWEGKSGKPAIDKTQGSVVPSKDVAPFLMGALRAQGLSESEAKDFIDYWAPRMQGKSYDYVYFMPQADYDTLIPLHVSPKPDTVIRVYMLWKQLDQPVTVTPQRFTSPKRTGFTVVEWGGDRSQI